MSSQGDFNPYEAPRVESYAIPPEELPAGELGFWRQGEFLVAHEEAPLYSKCVVTGQPAEAHYLWSIGNVSSICVWLPTSAQYVHQWRKDLAIVIGATFAAIALGIFWARVNPLDLETARPWDAIAIMLSGVSFSSIWYFQRMSPLSFYTSSEPFHWIGGVHPEFLATLPPWPYESK